MDIEIKEGFIYYKKNGKIEVVKIPEYGTLAFKSKEGRLYQLDKNLTEKI